MVLAHEATVLGGMPSEPCYFLKVANLSPSRELINHSGSSLRRASNSVS
jgi:hypothetical protein